MTDARFRILNNGIVGQDVFFHPDNLGWGMVYYDCEGQGSSGYSLGIAANRYLTGGGAGWKIGLPQSYKDTIQSDELANAFHVFVSRGTWVDMNNDSIVGVNGLSEHRCRGAYFAIKPELR